MIRRACQGLYALLACLPALRAQALDALSFAAREIDAGAVRLVNVEGRLAIRRDATTAATITIARAHAPAGHVDLHDVRLECAAPVIADPRFGCDDARLTIARTPIGPLAIALSGDYRTDNAAGAARASIGRLAGGRLLLRGRTGPSGWQAEGEARDLDIARLRELVAPWFELPAGWTLEGSAAARFTLHAGRGPMHADASLALTAVNLSNEASTIIADGADATLGVSLEAQREGYDVTMTLQGRRGQALAGPVLLDFNGNPLAVEARGRLRDEVLTLAQLQVHAPRLLALRGSATIGIGATPRLAAGRFEIDALEFPAAYTSLMQIPLAATDFGDLVTSGRARGSVVLADNAVTRVDLALGPFAAHNEREFFLKDVTGELHWAAGAHADVSPSWLAWSSGGAYGLSGGASRVEFVTRGAGFTLTEPWHMPVFDGAVDIRTLAVRGAGTPGLEVRFAADIEPISLPPLCKAFGWPEFSGRIGGRIPGVELRGNELTVEGDIEARVFDGTVVASHLRLVDPLGKWPRFFADVRGRNLDLELITRAFAFGSITGRLDADVLGLELFGWSPVAFDARLETPKDDRSRHRISAKAVKELSNVGGGGGGVTQALQSGVLRFFDEYGYDRIGLRCRLANDVCLMSGVEPAPSGYYIVKGRGLPRIDIIGNQGRVNWPQLVRQVASGLEAQGVVVD